MRSYVVAAFARLARMGRRLVKAITEEQRRILIAASEGRLSYSARRNRYGIDGERPPDRREREKLQKRGLLTRPSSGKPIFTERGLRALEAALAGEHDQEPPEQLELAGSRRALIEKGERG